MELIELHNKLENIVNKYQDIIGTEADQLSKQFAIQTLAKTKEAIKQIENENRLLQIGIIGRVKAGKSSLLNAMLFDGKSILPKAATPMTAALTVISYGEVLSAEVEFFTQKDIQNIEKEYNQYEKQLAILTQKAFDDLKQRNEKKKSKLSKVIPLSQAEVSEIQEKANRQAKREIKSQVTLCASYDQFNRIKNSGVEYLNLANRETLDAKSLEELSDKLLKYVGADGKYMPFTKSVHIKVPQENIKNIQIVDTPGVNDPVQSREERTKELLKFCDVILIVSPSGQFLSQEDVDLMDRITAKEGVRELYVVASQVDLQLFGSVKVESNGLLDKAFSSITLDLAEHLHSTLSTLKENNPEIGNAYDQLIEQSSSKIIHSSGICHTIRHDFEKKTSWDEGIKKAWDNLTRHYPDYFSDTDKTLSFASLDMLSNIASIDNIISEIKGKKNVILQRRKHDFIQAKTDVLKTYKDELLKYISEQVDTIKNGNIEDLKQQQKKIQSFQSCATGLDEKYFGLVDNLRGDMDKQLILELDRYFKEMNKSVKGAEGSDSERYEIDNGRGLLCWRSMSGNRYETGTRHYTTVRAGAVTNAIISLTSDIETTIDLKSRAVVMEWKKQLDSQLLTILRAHNGGDKQGNDKLLDINQIKKVIRNVLSEVIEPQIVYRDSLPSSLSATGTLTESAAETFIGNAQSYITALKLRVKDDIKVYSKQLNNALAELQLSDTFFEHYDNLLKELERQVNNKAVTLDRFERLINELAEVKFDAK